MRNIVFILIAFTTLHNSFSQGEWTWSNQLRSPGDVYPSSNIVMDVQIDENNNIYHCGAYDSQSLSIQGNTIAGDGGNWDAFVCKFDNQGNLLWLNRITSSNRDEAAALVIADGFIYLAGSYKNSDISFPPSATTLVNNGNYDVFLSKYTLDGTFVKATRVFWGTNVNRVKDMTYDPFRKELVVTGFFKTDIHYTDGSDPDIAVATQAGGKDMFVAQMDTSGAVNGFTNIWTKDSKNNTVIKDINMSADSSYYLTGDLYDTLFFPTDDTITGNANSGILLFKMDKNLALEWARTAGGSGFDHANSATSDADGLVYIAGKVESEVTFDSTETHTSSPITGAEGSDLFIAKYNTNGRLLWVKRKGKDGADDAFGINVNENLVQFCGNYADTLIINDDTLTSTGTSDINTGFAIFDLDGNEIGAQGFGGNSEDIGRVLTFDNNGNTIVAGYFTSDNLEIGDSSYSNTTVGLRDGFIASYTYPFKVSIKQEGEILCSGSSNAELVGYTYYGVSPYQYQWSPNVTSFNDSVAYNLSAGEYYLTVTDSRDSTVTTYYTVSEPTPIAIDLDSTNLTCHQSADGSITTNVTGGLAPYSFIWSGAPGYDPVTQNQSGLSAGKFFVTVTDQNNCSVKDSINVLQPEKISSTAVVTPETSGLSNGSIELDVTGGTSPYTYEWKFEGSQYRGDKDTITNLDEGLYSVHVQDDNLCTYDTSIVVPGDSLRVLLSGTDISCSGAKDGKITALIESGRKQDKTYTYEFLDSNKTEISSSSDSSLGDTLSPGWYHVILTESGTGKKAYDSVKIVEPDSLKITLSTIDALCNGEGTTISTLITGGTPDYRFLWSNGDTTQSIANINAGEYSLTVTDANMCQVVGSAETFQPASLLINVVESSPISCFGGNNGKLRAEASGGTAPYSYSWNDYNRQNTATASLLVAGVYEVQVSDKNNCEKNVNYKLKEPELMILDRSEAANISCFDYSDGHLEVFMSGGTPPYSYDWGSLSTLDTNYVDGLFAGEFTVTVRDSKLCGDSVYSFTVKAPESALNLSEITENHQDNRCYADSAGTLAVNATGGWGGYTYSIDSEDWSETSEFSKLKANDYTIEVADLSGCTKEISVKVTEPSALLIENEEVTGNKIVITASGGTGPYQYSFDQENWQTSGTFESLANGDYTIYLTDANNCGPVAGNAQQINVNSVEKIQKTVSRIYPNPSKGLFNVKIEAGLDTEVLFEVYSLTGTLVLSERKAVYSNNSLPVTIDLSAQPKGVYIIKLNGVTFNEKLIVE